MKADSNNIKEVQGKPQLELLRGISGAFRPGVMTCLMGVSGAGKTTLMDVLAGRKTSKHSAILANADLLQSCPRILGSLSQQLCPLPI